MAGLDLPSPSGWTHTGPRPPLLQLDAISSPFQLGLMPGRSVAYLETFRGCPLSCTFCEWGASDGAKAVFSTDYLVRELESFAELEAPAVFLLDAGLNLNARGFRNLCAAEAQVGFLKSIKFWCEIYPTLVKDEHLDFLAAIGPSYLGVGLQSLDQDVLDAHDARLIAIASRPTFPNSRSSPTWSSRSSSVCPERLRRASGGRWNTLARSRWEFGRTTAWCCPTRSMLRGRPEWNIQFDPLNLNMISCLGWTPEDFQEMRGDLTREALDCGGAAGEFWWFFPPGHEAARRTLPRPVA